MAQTAPYMHDDRFATLEEAVVHDQSADPDPYRGGMGLTTQERADLVAFLRSLTDEDFLTDPALAAP